MDASQNGHVEVVDKLLQYGARVDLITKKVMWYISRSIMVYGGTVVSKFD